MKHIRHFATAAGTLAVLVGLKAVAVIPAAASTVPPQQLQQAGANGQTIAGISCDAQEGQRIHIHQHLLVMDHGKPIPIPANIGIPAAKSCIYWVHTHTPDGIIHIEAPQDRSFTLGDFFQVWGQPLDKTQAATAVTAKGQAVKVWVNGKRYTGDPRKIALVPHADIVIEVGPPFPKPPRFTNWGKL
ncbi:MAG: hypothetical protein ABI442_17155 [Gemmatimonadaceae bacterium]